MATYERELISRLGDLAAFARVNAAATATAKQKPAAFRSELPARLLGMKVDL